jgi:hypothetical protein
MISLSRLPRGSHPSKGNPHSPLGGWNQGTSERFAIGLFIVIVENHQTCLLQNQLIRFP